MTTQSSAIRYSILFIIALPFVAFLLTVGSVYGAPKETGLLDIPSGENQINDEKEKLPIEVNADNVEYHKEEETVIGTGNVVITFKEVKLAADKITVHLLTKDAYAEGNVRFYQADRLYTAEEIYYNFGTEEAKFINADGRFKPFYLHGGIVTKVPGKAEYHVENGYVTTSDYRLPDYRLKAKEVHIYPQDKVIMKNIVFEVANIPLFWFPYWYYPLDGKDTPFSVVPGHSGKFGYYVLTSAQIYRSQNLKINLAGDYRTKRGAAGGVDAEYNFNDEIKGEIKTYFMRDRNFQEYEVKSDGTERRREYKKNRFRITWEHEQQIFDDTRLLGQLNLQSDKQITEDFFRSEFEEVIQRVNFLDLTKATESYQLEAYVSPRFNSFFDVLERLPEVSFTKKNQPLFDWPIFYQSDIRLSNLRFRFDDEKLNFDATRLASFHKISYPLFLGDFLSVIPYIEGRSVTYSDMRRGSDDMRLIFATGFDSTFRVSKIYDVESDNWNIHGIRHIMENKVNYRLVRTSVDVDRVYQFDLIDSVTHDGYFAFEFRHLFQTKRHIETIEFEDKKTAKPVIKHKGIEEVSRDLVDFSIHFDIFPTGAKRDTIAVGHTASQFSNLSPLDFFFIRNIKLGTPYLASKKGKNISDLMFDMKFRPFDWLSTQFSVRYDPHERQIEEVIWAIGYFYKDKIAWDVSTSFVLGGSTQLSHTFTYRLNDEWRFRVSHILDFNREGDAGGLFQHERYTLIKDLHEWEMAFSYSASRYYRLNKEVDRSFFVIFYLKDFPDVRLKLGN